MATEASKPEIDNHVMKLIVGVIALTLAALTSYFSQEPLGSISASYHSGGLARDVFVGFLFAISAFLIAYNGKDLPEEMILAKVAAIAGLGVAVLPCDCGTGNEVIRNGHFIAAAVMFLVLAAFCWLFYRRARAKHHRRANWRATVYAICGVVIVGAVLVLSYDGLTGGSMSAKVERLIFYGETAGLIAFGVSWLVASRVLPGITNPDERVRVLPVVKRPVEG